MAQKEKKIMGAAKKSRKEKHKNKLTKLMQKFRPIPLSKDAAEFRKYADYLQSIANNFLKSLGIPPYLLTMQKHFLGIQVGDVVSWEELIVADNHKALTIFLTGRVIGLDPTTLRTNYEAKKSLSYFWLVNRCGMIRPIYGTALTVHQRPEENHGTFCKT